MVELKKLYEMLDINPVLLDNPNSREDGIKQLLAKAQQQSNDAVVAKRKLQQDFELWGESLVSPAVLTKMQKACTAVQEEFSNYPVKYNTPARLNNFRLSVEQVDELAENVKLIRMIGEYDTFKKNCAQIVSYIASIEYLDLGTAFRDEMESAKETFRCIRDSIMDGTSGESASQSVISLLESIRNKYIDLYFEEHKKKRLDIHGAKRRGKLLESPVLANLRKLRGIEILSGGRLTAIEQDLSDLKVCYELTGIENDTGLPALPLCPWRQGKKCGGEIG